MFFALVGRTGFFVSCRCLFVVVFFGGVGGSSVILGLCIFCFVFVGGLLFFWGE